MTEIGFVAENIGYCGGFPIVRCIGVDNRTVLACFGVSVNGRLEYLPIAKDITNVLGAYARGAEGNISFTMGAVSGSMIGWFFCRGSFI